MKLRFRNNSLRLRVNQREVKDLAGGETLAEEVQFPGDTRISYVLEPSFEGVPKASFQQGVIRVTAPREQVQQWATSDAIGLYFELPANGTTLRIAIEKDLECMDGKAEEQDPHAFPRGIGKNC